MVEEMKRRWFPLPIYYMSPLARNQTIPTKLPHKLGYIPDFCNVKNESMKSKIVDNKK